MILKHEPATPEQKVRPPNENWTCGFFLVLAAAVWFSSCSFAGRPSLPKRAAIESVAPPQEEEQFAEIVQEADIIYFATDRVGAALTSEPAWKLVRALRESGAEFGLGWGVIESGEQAFLDNSNQNAAERLDITGTMRERENCRTLLREMRALGIQQVALGCPRDLIAKMHAGEPLDAVTEPSVPHGFEAPPGGLVTFTEHLSPARGLLARQVAELYRAALLSQQFAAERIIRYLQEHKGAKLLVFQQRRELESWPSVPFFVAQKMKLRQVVLDSRRRPAERADLLTAVGGGSVRGRCEIID